MKFFPFNLWKEIAKNTVVESDVYDEAEPVEQLHSTEGESKQTKPSELRFGKERLSGVEGDAPAGKVAGTDNLSMEESVSGDIAGQSETGVEHGREHHVLAPIGTAVEEEEVASKGLDPSRQEDQTVTILVNSQEEATDSGRVEAEQLERSEEARVGDTTVEGEVGAPHGGVVERTAEDSGEKDIPTEREEERPVWPSVRGEGKQR